VKQRFTISSEQTKKMYAANDKIPRLVILKFANLLKVKRE
jgi:hypothetical protein